jgi:lipopolysaccharide/colanic/teichoic acid biosynthesis glycosyltransferase
VLRVTSRPEPATDVSPYAVACRRSVPSRVLERTLDVTVSACLLVLLAPLWAIVAVAIRLDSRGPVLYRQRRRGEGDRTFLMLKFRTMTVDADDRLAEVLALNMHAELGDPRMYKIPNDPRVTCCGALLRRYSLDEFPQLLNVLRGEMSLVGPRPLMLMEDRNVSGPGVMRRTVKPGLTGPWQVSGRNEIPFEEMLRLDCAYVRDCSVLGDLRLILKTVPLLFRAQQPC